MSDSAYLAPPAPARTRASKASASLNHQFAGYSINIQRRLGIAICESMRGGTRLWASLTMNKKNMNCGL
jgi:hypothetical protein